PRLREQRNRIFKVQFLWAACRQTGRCVGELAFFSLCWAARAPGRTGARPRRRAGLCRRDRPRRNRRRRERPCFFLQFIEIHNLAPVSDYDGETSWQTTKSATWKLRSRFAEMSFRS